MLAYVFWHQPAPGVAAEEYERALSALHASLANHPPAGWHRSVTYRADRLPWLEDGAGYEDWYVVEDFTALGVLGEAAVGHEHLRVHDAAAGRSAPGATAGIYRLIDGTAHLDGVRIAAWIVPGPDRLRTDVADLLADGLDAPRGGLWRRALALGPAPELCLLTTEPTEGLAAARIGSGWHATIDARVQI